ncbi:DUF7064 domain-containing protein [Novosphingobium taihuense]|uniref:Uncharacterized protein n=1 Tax=Novosphingobium taihuense TaxID=260085 RepID=A0A7W7ADE6_9SPHN|nr:hypothetical protein [Novosphingobium taihuense]MBB4615025.1 hypothetical protein [Novosphingobium taihuense]TWH84533.1 hypothetical protein IQ25_02288 [Novosphingobium taihuense]
MQVFSEADDRPHQHDDNPLWQESSLFCWYDIESGTGGFWRLGQEPIAQAINSCFGVFDRDGNRFRSNVTGVPMNAADRGEGHMGWGSHLRVDFDGHAKIKADFPECGADLKFVDFHPRFDYQSIALEGGSVEGLGHHFEVAGRMTGTVRIGDREITVDALGYRDRSWSVRDWTWLRGTRWWPCVFGPDLSTHVVQVARDGGIIKAGYIWRDGKTIPLADSDVVVAMESDAMTPRSGHGVLHLANGETLNISCDRADAVVMHVRGYTAVETLGTALLDGRRGMSNLEVCTNATGGNSEPVCALGSNLTNGLSLR